jgi:uncharacterized protein YjiS (DUF1127 family)
VVVLSHPFLCNIFLARVFKGWRRRRRTRDE